MTAYSESNADDPSVVVVHEDLTYAERDAGDLKLDLYVPKPDAGDNRPPLVVYIHGGAWIYETRKNAPDLERFAAEWNCALASVSYRLAAVPDDVDLPFDVDPENPTPRGVFPDPIIDVKAAIRWCRAHADTYGFNGEHIAAWGSSAGGHLAALAGVVDDVTDIAGDAYPAESVRKAVEPTESGAVQAVIDWYGVHDLLELPGIEETPESLLLGGPLSANQDRARRASPVTYVTPDDPPFCIMHGREDEVVSVEQSCLLFDELANAGVDAAFYDLHDLGHVWGGDSERTAMAALESGDHAQTVTATATTRTECDETTTGPLLVSHPPAGPDAIGTFLERTLREGAGDGSASR
ncbi:alpha/beta hydrolase [Natronolimnobius sp. AArcel1]|uniref:alpha/beta hydrolase n=1 Tax=Natronolimnobius sp. AArcel1 TaxID=1679093 RepID=UPI0013EBD6A7|nr:alpha/beta hydrolase [Natronolimnobius sp. AArcel1]NGM69545.1 alpha/beta hydrolase [Natronolimnobius sp. AArcel1]